MIWIVISGKIASLIYQTVVQHKPYDENKRTQRNNNCVERRQIRYTNLKSNLNSTRKCLIKKRKNINPNKENHHTLTRFEFNEHIIDNKKKGRKTPYYQEDKLVVGVEHIWLESNTSYIAGKIATNVQYTLQEEKTSISTTHNYFSVLNQFWLSWV